MTILCSAPRFLMFSVIALFMCCGFFYCYSFVDSEDNREIIVSSLTAVPPNIVLEEYTAENEIDPKNLQHLMTPYTHYELNESEHDSKEILYTIAAHYGIPTNLLYAIHLKETHGECTVKSQKSAYGCFQFMASTAKQFGLIGTLNGKPYDLRNLLIPSGDAAARYIVWLAYVLYGEDTDLQNWEQLEHVLAAYNAGIARVLHKGSEPRIPSFFETQKYVHDIVRLSQGEAFFVTDEASLEIVSLKTKIPESLLLQSNVHLTDSTSVYHGMILAVPDMNTNQAELLVSPKMSLSKISAGTGISAKEIMRANGLKTPRLRTGMVLKIPVEPAS